MTIGVVSVALASAALLAPTAIAAPKGSDLRHENSVSDKKGRQSAGQSYYKTSPLKTSKPSVYRSRGRYDRDRSIYNRDQSHHLSHRERRRAIQICAGALDRKTNRFFPGRFGDAEFARRPSVAREGRKGRAIEVSGPVRVSNRGGSGIVPASCVIKSGRLVQLRFEPLAINKAHHNRGHQRVR